jgi:predicted acylesterase/phospholipase RssA
MKVGVFFSPGAARAAYQLGVVQGLVHDGGVRFDVVAGSSVGALLGAFTAMGRIDELVAQWATWRTPDVMRVDWRGLLRGAVLWAPGLMAYQAYRTLISDPVVHVDRLLPGTRFRMNVANLTAGDQSVWEWPGASLPLAEGVNASVAVPVVIPPRDRLGQQWADGLTVDGFPLEALILETGLDRVFVAGVAPRHPDATPCPNVLRIAMRAMDWNQQSETTIGLERAEATNAIIRAWRRDRAEVEQAVRETVDAPDLQAALLAEVDAIYAASGFPYRRDPVEIVSILPAEQIQQFVGSYSPARTRALIAQGREDACAVLGTLGS